jgi:carbonic anhydrase/acetyltransferase-like protein (isoleucine patch superfamily)
MSDRARRWPNRPTIHGSAFIAPGAVVVGEATLGARSSVWFNTVVRADMAAIAIGDDTNLQDNSTVHVDEDCPTLIGARVTVGHRAIVHGCVIEDDCLIGMGAILLSRARIGAGSLIGAGALVLEGQVIPPGSVALGSPARVVGPTGAAHREAIRAGAIHYADMAKTYLERGYGRSLPDPARAGGIAAPDRGPMHHAEWRDLVAILAESPGWVARRGVPLDDPRWRTVPRPGGWSALDVLHHLWSADREVYRGRIERMLAEAHPWIEDVDLTRDASAGREDPTQALAAWTDLRALLAARLEPLRPAEWDRAALHSRRGAFTLGQMVRGWVDHDLAHRRQLERALGAAR